MGSDKREEGGVSAQPAFRDDYWSTSEISRRLGFNVTAAFISRTLKIKPSFATSNGFYYSPEQVDKVLAAIVQHIQTVRGL